ncbi:acyltransferase, partial [Frankia sp. CpI1-P]
MRLARERRHTLYFLEEIRRFSPVFLDTEVDMTRVNEHRAREREAGRRYSPLAYLVLASAAVLADHPAANAAIRGRFLPRVTSYPDVNTKITFDRTLNGQRVVLSAVLTGAGGASLEEIQGWLDRFRAVDPTTAPEFAGARALHRLPMALGRQAFRARVRPLAGRAAVMGTVAVTSLGHRPIDSFHSVGGTTVTFGVGRVQDRPVARDGQVRIAPVLRLSM